MTSDTKMREAAHPPETSATASSPTAADPIRFAPERPQDAVLIDALVDRAFGPGRFAKTAERLREGAGAHSDLSLCAWAGAGERLAGAVRLWPASIGERSALFLGPIAVERTFRHRGVGAELVERACARARSMGEQVVVLVGDLAFFGPLGFKPVPAGRVTLPGPVDPGRLLWAALSLGVTECASGALSLRASA